MCFRLFFLLQNAGSTRTGSWKPSGHTRNHDGGTSTTEPNQQQGTVLVDQEGSDRSGIGSNNSRHISYCFQCKHISDVIVEILHNMLLRHISSVLFYQ